MKKIIHYLYEVKEDYPLFANEISKIESAINLDEITVDKLPTIIIELLKIYHCDSVNGNLKELGLGDRIGRLSGKNIDSGIVVATSITGIRNKEYEF